MPDFKESKKESKKEYKIVNSDLGYRIFRHPKGDDSEREYYDVRGEWNKNRAHSRIFFHRVDAESALVLIRMKGGKEKTDSTSSTQDAVSEKKSWSEFG